MQRAARRQLTRHVTCHFQHHRIFFMNATFPQSMKAPADDHRHHLHWFLQRLFSASQPSRLTVMQSCLHLSLLIRCFSTGSPLPSLDSDGFLSTNQPEDRNVIEVQEDVCFQAVYMKASEPLFDNTEVSASLARNQEERSGDILLTEAGKVFSSSVLISDASGQLNTKQVGLDGLYMEPHSMKSFQNSHGSECATLPSEIEVQLRGNVSTHARDGAICDGVASCDYSSPFDTTQAGKHESCIVSNDRATGVYPLTSNVKSPSSEPCTMQSHEEDFMTSCEVSVLWTLEKHGWGLHSEDALSSYINILTPEFVAKVVDNLRDTKVAFSLLQWVGKQENYFHREEIFTKVVGRLGKDKEFEVAWEVLQYMKRHGLKVDYAFSIFIHRLKSANMADSIVKAIDSMMSLDVMPTVPLYTLALQVTLKTNNLEIAQRLYNQLRQAGLQPDAKLFGTLLTGFGKAGMVKQALFFFKEMQRDNVPIDRFTYTRLIRAFAVAGQYVEGQKFFAEMVQNGCLPVALSRADLDCALYGIISMEQIKGFLKNLENRGHLISVHTYNNMIQYFLDRKLLPEAVELFQKLLRLGEPLECNCQPSAAKGATRPNKVSYSLLICGLCKGGQLTEAILLFREMLMKGMSTTSDLCNCLLHGLSSNEGFMYEAVELARHIAKEKLNVDVETQKVFFRALKAGGDVSKAFKIFDTLKWRGCIDSSSNFYVLSNVEG